MEIYEILKNDHQEVKDLFEDIDEFLRNGNFEEAESAFETLRVELTAHSKAEQEVFYQPLKVISEDLEDDEVSGEELLGEAEQEHHLVALLLNELSRLDVEEEDWKAKLTVLQELVDHHIETEEGEIFDEARKCFSAEEAEMIAENMQDLKEKYKGMIESALAEDIALFNQPIRNPVDASQTSFSR
ncbi:MAG TPA: hemerythrin domain-containing protein [Pseudobdellovibrionaceae bacterium]|jgi:hemerythrin-like domain-containing protein